MEGNTLWLKDKQFTMRNLHELPPELNGFEVSSKKDKHVYAFFRELNPLRNFHPSPFEINGRHYHSSEQYIQHQKAEFLGDLTSTCKILATKMALEAKNIGRRIAGSKDKNQCNQNARDICYPGIAA